MTTGHKAREKRGTHEVEFLATKEN